MFQAATARRGSGRPPGIRRQDRSVRSRAAILAAAERLFAGSGLDGTRTETIAAEAGVNKALLYYYFKSKDALYEAVVENHAREFHQRAMAAMDSRAEAGEVILAYVGMSFDFIAARPYFPALIQRLSMSGGRRFERLARKYSVPLADRLAAVIERGVRSGEFRPVDPEHTVISLAALTRFYFAVAPILRAVTGNDPYEEGNLRRRRNEVLEFVRYGLFRNPEAYRNA